MRLTGDSFQQLRDVLNDAFDENRLRAMLRIELETDLDAVVAPGPRLTRVEDLIRWAEYNGRTQDLLTAAQANNSTNQQLAAVHLDFTPGQPDDSGLPTGHGQGWESSKEEKKIGEHEESSSSELHEHDESEEIEDELGLLDYLEIAEHSFDSAKTIIDKIGSDSEKVTVIMTDGTEEFNQLKEAGARISDQKRVLSRIAQAMNDYSDQMENDVPKLALSLTEGIEAHTGMMQVLSDFSTRREELIKLLTSVRNMNTNVLKLAESANAAGRAIGQWPRITKEINRAKRRTEQILAKLAEYLDVAIKQTEEFIRALEKYISGLS